MRRGRVTNQNARSIITANKNTASITKFRPIKDKDSHGEGSLCSADPQITVWILARPLYLSLLYWHASSAITQPGKYSSQANEDHERKVGDSTDSTRIG